MFVVKLGSSCSMQIYPRDMPPSKKLKTSAHVDGLKDVTKIKTRPPSNSEYDLGENWREKCKGVISTNTYALKKGILTDVTFIVGPEKTMHHAHRLILGLGSPVFEAMFFGALAEKGDTITIPDVSSDGFSHLLRYLYSDDFIFRDGEDAFKTYVAADKYCVNNLKEHCERYLCSCELSPANVWLFLESSLFLNSDAITVRCTNYLRSHTEAAFQHSSFLDVGTKTVESLLCLDDLEVSEIKLFLNVVRWAEYKSNVDQSESFQDIISPLLRYIRFGALTPAQFISVLETKKLKELLNDHDALAILKHLIQPMSCPLPDWCCSKTCRENDISFKKVLRVFSKSRNEELAARFFIRKGISNSQYYSSSSSSSSTSSSSAESIILSSDSEQSS